MRYIAIVLAVGVCTAGMPQGPKTTARRSAPVELALQIADYATLPITGSPTGTGNNAGSLARINFMREEPAPSRRFFVNDLNGPLYILNRTTKNATIYLDFNGRGVMRGLFDRLARGGRAGQRPHQLRVRSRLRNQRPLLHHPPRRSGSFRRPRTGQRRRSRPAGHWLCADSAGSESAHRRSRRRADRVDRLQHFQFDVRRIRQGVAARAALQPDPPHGRSDLQSGGAARRSGLAGARTWRAVTADRAISDRAFA